MCAHLVGDPRMSPHRCADQGRRTGHYVRMPKQDSDQRYCDWCFGDLTESARVESLRIGLAAQSAWACVACLAAGRPFQSAPEGWDNDFPWPFLSVGTDT